jgi:hypothetical protein
MKRNWKLTLPIVLGVISLLAVSVSISPSTNLAAMVKAQSQNQSAPSEVQQSLVNFHKSLE